MLKLISGMACLLVIVLVGNTAPASVVTGNPVTDDGWTSGGNSLANDVYVRGNANYSYDTYSMVTTVQAASNLNISDGANSWLVGDTVLGVGGHFVDITAVQAGWTAFTGNTVNGLLGGADLGADTKLQVKFGTSVADFTTSTIAPNAGDGHGSFGTYAGLGAVQIRTSAWFYAADWSAGSGVLQLLDKPEHIERNDPTTPGPDSPDADVARLIWNWDAINDRVDTWEILLNASLLERLDPDFPGDTPDLGGLALMTVQNRDGVYTDALVRLGSPSIASDPPAVPEPATFVIWSLLGALGLAVGWRWRAKP
jgi:hypothetical protein